MSLITQSAPLANLVGTILAAYPAIRAAIYLRYRTSTETNSDSSEQSDFSELRQQMNRQLEAIAQEWSPRLFFIFVSGIALLVYGAFVNALIAYGFLVSG